MTVAAEFAAASDSVRTVNTSALSARSMPFGPCCSISAPRAPMAPMRIPISVRTGSMAPSSNAMVMSPVPQPTHVAATGVENGMGNVSAASTTPTTAHVRTTDTDPRVRFRCACHQLARMRGA